MTEIAEVAMANMMKRKHWALLAPVFIGTLIVSGTVEAEINVDEKSWTIDGVDGVSSIDAITRMEWDEGTVSGGLQQMKPTNATSKFMTFTGWTDWVHSTDENSTRGVKYRLNGTVNYTITPDDTGVTIKVTDVVSEITGQSLQTTILPYLSTVTDRHVAEGGGSLLETPAGTYGMNFPFEKQELLANYPKTYKVNVSHHVNYGGTMDFGTLLGMDIKWATTSPYYNTDVDTVNAQIKFKVGKKVEDTTQIKNVYYNKETGEVMCTKYDSYTGLENQSFTYTAPTLSGADNQVAIDGKTYENKYVSGAGTKTGVNNGKEIVNKIYYYPPHVVKWQAYDDESGDDLGTAKKFDAIYFGDTIEADKDDNGWADGMNGHLGDFAEKTTLWKSYGTYGSPDKHLGTFDMTSLDVTIKAGSPSLITKPNSEAHFQRRSWQRNHLQCK
jgi:hypothetical protein